MPELFGNEKVQDLVGNECSLQPSMNGTDGWLFRALQGDIMASTGIKVHAAEPESLHGKFNCNVAGVPETAELLPASQPELKPELAPGMKPA